MKRFLLILIIPVMAYSAERKALLNSDSEVIASGFQAFVAGPGETVINDVPPLLQAVHSEVGSVSKWNGSGLCDGGENGCQTRRFKTPPGGKKTSRLRSTTQTKNWKTRDISPTAYPGRPNPGKLFQMDSSPTLRPIPASGRICSRNSTMRSIR